MKEQNEKQAIEEMVEISRHVCEGECFINKDGLIDCDVCRSLHFYDNGYRKQSVGEWKQVCGDLGWVEMECSVCGYRDVFDDDHREFHKYCPNCGARMKGGDE